MYVCSSLQWTSRIFKIFLQLIPESPRYLIVNGKEDKAKKVLALVAKINCKPPMPMSGRLVIQEEKERMLEEKNQTSSPVERAKQSTVGSVNQCNEIDIQPNEEERVDTELTVILSGNASDREQLLTLNEFTCKKALTWTYIKFCIKNSTTKYRNWFLILFKNGYWRTTIILWYLW